jgi:hypothetical protein
MIKLSNKKVKQRTVWLSAEGPSIRWDSRKLGVGEFLGKTVPAHD